VTASKRNPKIANIQFLLSVLVVLIHGVTIFINLPGSETQYIYGKNFSTFLQIFIGDGIARIAVPTFFIISGYLFYINFDGSFKAYGNKIQKRIRSLVIPYLFWSALTFFAFYIAQKIPAIAPYFSTRNAGELSFEIILENIIIGSYNSPLWFCRYLIVFAALSMLFYYVGKKIPGILLLITLGGWLIDLPINIGIRMDAVFFYSLGLVIAIHNDRLSKFLNVLNKGNNKIIATSLLTTVWIIVLICRTIHYCGQSPDMMLNGTYDNFVVVTGNLGIICGIPAFWNLYDYIIKNQWKIWKLSTYSFLIFVCHHPLVNTLKKLIMKVIGVTELTSIITYFLATVISIAIILFFGWFLKRYLKRVWDTVTGGRM
jgi:fucose 4-O-acetylase-like acetyltransferase